MRACVCVLLALEFVSGAEAHEAADEATRQKVQRRRIAVHNHITPLYQNSFFIWNSFVPFWSVSSYQKRLPCECEQCTYVFYCIITIIELVYFRFSLCAAFRCCRCFICLYLFMYALLARLCSCNGINCMSWIYYLKNAKMNGHQKTVIEGGSRAARKMNAIKCIKYKI